MKKQDISSMLEEEYFLTLAEDFNLWHFSAKKLDQLVERQLLSWTLEPADRQRAMLHLWMLLAEKGHHESQSALYHLTAKNLDGVIRAIGDEGALRVVCMLMTLAPPSDVKPAIKEMCGIYRKFARAPLILLLQKLGTVQSSFQIATVILEGWADWQTYPLEVRSGIAKPDYVDTSGNYPGRRPSR